MSTAFSDVIGVDRPTILRAFSGRRGRFECVTPGDDEGAGAVAVAEQPPEASAKAPAAEAAPEPIRPTFCEPEPEPAAFPVDPPPAEPVEDFSWRIGR